MGLDEYGEPKGAYYTPALVARFEDEAAAEAAVSALREVGFSVRDIQVGRQDDGVTVIVSEPSPGLLQEARGILAQSNAADVRPYGA